MIRASGSKDPIYTKLIVQIGEGFPNGRRLTDIIIRDYWEVRHRLSVDKGLILMDKRLAVPAELRKRVLQCLHSAHQGVGGMKARANETVYWPGMNRSIQDYRDSCGTCNRIAPSLSREPIILTKSPDWPFQQIVGDLFHVEHHKYLACADRLTGWLMLYHLPNSNAANLIRILRSIFEAYGAPEELSSDGGPPFSSDQV